MWTAFCSSASCSGEEGLVAGGRRESCRKTLGTCEVGTWVPSQTLMEPSLGGSLGAMVESQLSWGGGSS